MASAMPQSRRQLRSVTLYGRAGGSKGDSYGFALNNKDQVVGTLFTGRKDKAGFPIRHAFFWQNGHTIDLHDALKPRPLESEAVAINNNGEILVNGYAKSFRMGGRQNSTPWSKYGSSWVVRLKGGKVEAHAVPHLPGYKYNVASSLNDSGEIATSIGPQLPHPNKRQPRDNPEGFYAMQCRYDAGHFTRPRLLPTPYQDFAYPLKIDNSGRVFGKAEHDAAVPFWTDIHHAGYWKQERATTAPP